MVPLTSGHVARRPTADYGTQASPYRSSAEGEGMCFRAYTLVNGVRSGEVIPGRRVTSLAHQACNSRAINSSCVRRRMPSKTPGRSDRGPKKLSKYVS